MLFDTLLGQEHIKNHLITSASKGRVPHAQLFVGPEGCGTLAMAIAYAQYLICGFENSSNPEKTTSCALKFEHFNHPDLHFVYPTVTDEKIKKPKSLDFIKDWREFLTQNSYGGLFEWYKQLEVNNKQGMIRVDDATEIIKSLSLKSLEGNYKIMIIWMADKMNTETANKILKILEEPTDKTVLILITESEDDLLDTIKSRCQIVHFNALPEKVIAEALIAKKGIDEKTAQKIAHQSQGNFNKALQILLNDNDELPFEKWFVDWVRAAYTAKKNAGAIHDLIVWSEQIAALGREPQKRFLNYCINMFRQALLLNYEAKSLVYYEPIKVPFDLNKFAPFVNGNNIQEIFKELSEAIYHIERNGNAKIILTDLSIKLTRLIHKS